MKRYVELIVVAGAVLMGAASCSTTRLLADGEYRLAANKVEVVNDKKFNAGALQPYVKQRANSSIIFGWNPFLNVYNWSSRSGKGFFNKAFRKIGEAPVVYDPDMVESSAENIEKHLEYLGYYGSRVDTRVAVKKRRVTVHYDVSLGSRFPIGGIEYELPKDNEELAQAFHADSASIGIRPGDILSEASLEAETVRASSYFREQGFYSLSRNHFFFEADTLSRPGEALLKMSLREYTRNELPSEARPLERYRFGDVTISYPKSLKIREKPLRELNLVRPGDYYSESVVSSSYSRLSSMRLFSSVNMELTSRDSAIVDCNINLTPTKLQGMKFNLEASSNSNGLLGISPELSFYHKNIFHGGEWFNMSFMGNFQFKPRSKIGSNEFGVSAGLTIPRFVFLPNRLFRKNMPSTELKLSYNYQDRPEYRRNIISMFFGYSGSQGKFHYQYSPAQINVVRLFNIDEDFDESLSDNPFLKNAYQNHFDVGSSAVLYYNSSGETNPKHSYHYARLQLNIAGNLLSAFNPLMKQDEGEHLIWNTPYSQYVRAELSLGRTWRFGRKDGQAIAVRLLGGYGRAYGNSSALPFEQHFYAGGASSLRGWQAREVGPGHAEKDKNFVIPNQTGDMKLEANLEYRFKIFWKVDGAAFAETGNVWNLQSGDMSDPGRFRGSEFLSSLAADWGVGLRVDLNFILLRVDMGMRIHDPARESGDRWLGPDRWLRKGNYAFHFGVGYPF